ncbi:MAG: YybH family protein [Sphingomicrobium sp.]
MDLTKLAIAGLVASIVPTSPLLAHNPATTAPSPAALAAPARGAAAVVDAFHAALQRGDTSAAAALLADDALIFESGGAERTKAEYAGHHLPADAAFSQAVRSTVSRRSGNASGTLAWVATEGRLTGTYKGKAIDLPTTETMLLRRSGNGWKIVHIHWSSGAE